MMFDVRFFFSHFFFFLNRTKQPSISITSNSFTLECTRYADVLCDSKTHLHCSTLLFAEVLPKVYIMEQIHAICQQSGILLHLNGRLGAVVAVGRGFGPSGGGAAPPLLRGSLQRAAGGAQRLRREE